MGANAQTTVQKFLSGAVLTAEQQNFSAATGVPVFATTVTRDAAFGGANKVLAEGQLAYIEASDTVQYYSGAAWASVGEASKVVQMVNAPFASVATGTTTILSDDTIPQITEGDQYMTLAITPNNADNILVIDAVTMLTSSAGGNMVVALFVDSTADALAVASDPILAAQPVVTLCRHKMVAGSTSALTFRVRAGQGSAATTTFNGSAGGRFWGGRAASSITITEYTP